ITVSPTPMPRARNPSLNCCRECISPDCNRSNSARSTPEFFRPRLPCVMTTLRSEMRLQESVAEITRLLEKHRVLATMTQRQHGRRQNLLEQMQHRQNLVELNMRLRGMHSADIAHVLDALPPDDRLTVWQQVDRSQAGFVLVEVSESTRASLVDALSQEDLVSVLTSLDPEDLGYIADSLPPEVVAEVT